MTVEKNEYRTFSEYNPPSLCPFSIDTCEFSTHYENLYSHEHTTDVNKIIYNIANAVITITDLVNIVHYEYVTLQLKFWACWATLATKS
jgi:hypothetical protein